jgi:hypothetical protein
MSNTQRPKALDKLAPPWPSKTHHLTPAEARDVYQYVAALEEERDHYRDLVTALWAKEGEEKENEQKQNGDVLPVLWLESPPHRDDV